MICDWQGGVGGGGEGGDAGGEGGEGGEGGGGDDGGIILYVVHPAQCSIWFWQPPSSLLKRQLLPYVPPYEKKSQFSAPACSRHCAAHSSRDSMSPSTTRSYGLLKLPHRFDVACSVKSGTSSGGPYGGDGGEGGEGGGDGNDPPHLQIASLVPP
eukprot:scaffold21248_cov68-Phaeocystis_antarctica.AAC.4